MAEEYLVPFGIDATKVISGFKDIEDGQDKLIDKSKEVEKAQKDAFDSIGKEAKKVEDAFDKIAPKIEETANKSKELNDEIQKVGKSTTNAVDEKKVNRFRAMWERVKSTFTENTKAVKQLEQENQKLEKTLDSISDRMKEIKNTMPSEQDRKKYTALNQELQKLEKEYKDLLKLGREQEKQTESTTGKFGKFGGVLKTVWGFVAGAFAVSKIIDFGKAIIDTTAKFQKFEAVLKVALGSQSAARMAMIEMQEFAAKTPFGMEEAIGAYVKLVNRGIKPTKVEMTSLGDLASSQGKSLDQLTEALLDATTAEFERLKEFGIRAKKDGDTISLSFKGVTKEVKNSEEAIKDALIEMGKMQGVTGSMEEVSKTIGGAMSNLADSWDNLLNKIGEKIAPFVTGVIRQISEMVDSISDLLGEKENAITLGVQSSMQLKQEADNATRLKDRYIELKDKGVKATSREKAEMKNIVYQLRDAFGDSVVMIDKETGAMSLNLGMTEKLIKQKVLLSNVELGKVALQYNKALKDKEQADKDAKAARDAQKELGDPSVNLNNLQDPAARSKAMAQIASEDEASFKRFNSLRNEYARAANEGSKAAETLIQTREELAKYGFTVDDITFKNSAGIAEDAAKKTPSSSTDSKKNSKKQSDLDKEIAAQRLKFQRDLEDAALAQMEDGFNKEREAILKQYQRRKEDLQAEKSLSKENAQIKLNLLQEIDDEKLAKIKELEEKERATRLALKLESDAMINEMQADSLQKELTSIKLSFDAKEKSIRENYKNEKALQDVLLAELAQARLTAISSARREEERNEIEKDARLKIAIAEAYGDRLLEVGGTINQTEEDLAKGNSRRLEQIHKSKALTILAIEVDKAKKLAELAKKQYGDGSYEHQLAKAEVDKLVKEFGKELKSNAGTLNLSQLFQNIDNIGNGNLAGTLTDAFTFKLTDDSESIADMLGLDADEQAAIVGTFTAVFKAIQTAYTAMIQSQIEEKEKQIEELNVQIGKAEEAYNYELQLQKNGYASNVEAKEEEMSRLKAQRDKELEEKKKLLIEENRMAQTQIAIQTAVTAAQLIAAAAEAVAVHAGIPFVGVVLGLAAAASIITGIQAMKAKAKEVSKFGTGGVVDGKSHAQGGEKYYSNNPNANVIELEGGEHVTRKTVSEKNANFLEALNNDNLSNLGMNDYTLQKILNEVGVSLNTDEYKEAAETHYQVGKGSFNLVVGNGNAAMEEYLKSIDETNKRMANFEDEKEVVTFEDGYKVIKTKHYVRRIKIN